MNKAKSLLRSLILKYDKLVIGKTDNRYFHFENRGVAIEKKSVILHVNAYYNTSKIKIHDWEQNCDSYDIFQYVGDWFKSKIHNKSNIVIFNTAYRLKYVIEKLCKMILNITQDITELYLIVRFPLLYFEKNVKFNKFPASFVNKKYKIAIVDVVNINITVNTSELHKINNYNIIFYLYRQYYIKKALYQHIIYSDYEYSITRMKYDIDAIMEIYPKKMKQSTYKSFKTFMRVIEKYDKYSNNLTEKEKLYYKPFLEQRDKFLKILNI